MCLVGTFVGPFSRVAPADDGECGVPWQRARKCALILGNYYSLKLHLPPHNNYFLISASRAAWYAFTSSSRRSADTGSWDRYSMVNSPLPWVEERKSVEKPNIWGWGGVEGKTLWKTRPLSPPTGLQ